VHPALVIADHGRGHLDDLLVEQQLVPFLEAAGSVHRPFLGLAFRTVMHLPW